MISPQSGYAVDNALSAIWCFISHHETLVTGIAAVLAAACAVRATHRQIKQVQDHADRERAGKLRAARASFPIVLSGLCDYASASAKKLNSEWPPAARVFPDLPPPIGMYPVKVTLPEFPSKIIESMETVLEYVDDEPVAGRIESIYREMQIFHTRTSSLEAGDSIHPDQLGDLIIQAAAIYARAETLLTYARGKHHTISSDDLWDRVFNALRIMQIDNKIVIHCAKRSRLAGHPPGHADT